MDCHDRISGAAGKLVLANSKLGHAGSQTGRYPSADGRFCVSFLLNHLPNHCRIIQHVVTWSMKSAGSDCEELEFPSLSLGWLPIPVTKPGLSRGTSPNQPISVSGIGLEPTASTRETFRKWFGAIVKSSGLAGTCKKLRKSAGTEFEILNPGTGQILLGNERRTFERSYLDRSRIADIGQRPKKI